MGEDTRRRVGPEDLYNFRLIRECRLSPDGSRIVYSVERFDRVRRRAFRNLWIVATDGRSPPRPFTRGDRDDRCPRWSPDGRRIAFLSDGAGAFGGRTRLLVAPADDAGGGGAAGDRAVPAADLDGEYSDPAWSPDGRLLAFCFRPDDPPDGDSVVMGDDGRPEVIYRRAVSIPYKHDGVGWLPRTPSRLWLADVADRSAWEAEIEVLPRYTCWGPVWAPDGRRVYFVAGAGRAAGVFSVGMDKPDSGPRRRTRIHRAGDSELAESLAVSPDGRRFVAVTHAWAGDTWTKRLRVADLTPLAPPPWDLTHRLNRPVGNLTVGDLAGYGHEAPPQWSGDGRWVYFQVSTEGRTEVHAADLDGNTRRALGDGVVTDFSVASVDGADVIAAVRATPDEPSALVVTVDGGPPRTLVSPDREWLRLRERPTRTATPPTWKDRVVLLKEFRLPPGWVMRPPGFDLGRTWPAVLAIHGGPNVQYGETFMHEFECLAAAGYVVMFTNPRGSAGYGPDHARLPEEDWGTADYEDLRAAVRYLADLPGVDRARIGVMGRSYGGWMVNWMLGRTTRFAAAVSEAGLCDMISAQGSPEGRAAVPPPWENIGEIWRRSPLASAGRFSTPTLVMHAEEDDRCGLEQARELFAALRARDVPSELVVFPGECHDLPRTGRPDRRIARLRLIVRWFDRWLKR
jgi:dipeptidyl aminopeptidase/acylaminoacyl peptidase